MLVRRTFTRQVGILAVLAITAIGCGGDSNGSGAEDGEAPLTMSDEELREAAEAEGSVLWYTAIPVAASTAVAAAFTEMYPAIDVEVLRLPSFELWERFRTEYAANRNVADVISFSDWGVQKSAMSFGLLDRYVPPGIDGAVPSEYIDPLDGYGWAHRVTSIAILYNTDETPDEYVPTTWNDLLDPWWGENNRLAIGDPFESAAIYGAYWQMARAPGIGPEFFQGLGELSPPLYAQGGQQINAVVAGEHVATMVTDYQAWTLLDEGAPVAVVYPEVGVGNTVDFNSVVAAAPHPNAARLFMNYLGSYEGSDALARALNTYLTRTDAIPYPEGVGRPPVSEVPLLPLDMDNAELEFAEFNEQFNEWIGR